MSFIPLNRVEESEHDIEKHIREVELEKALKGYQEALKLQYSGQHDQAAELYDALLASEVLQEGLRKGPVETAAREDPSNRDTTRTNSSIGILPYLIFKNHGALILETLKARHDLLDQETFADTLRQVLLEYATALAYDSNDRALWQHVVKLAKILRLDRVQRFALETEIMSSSLVGDGHGLLWDSESRSQDQLTEICLVALLRQIGDVSSPSVTALAEVSHRAQGIIEDDINFLPMATGMDITTRISRPSVQVLTIRPTHCSWYALTRAIVEKLRVSHHNKQNFPVHFSIELPDWNESYAHGNSGHSTNEDEGEESEDRDTRESSTHMREVPAVRELSDDVGTEEIERDDGEVASETNTTIGYSHKDILETRANIASPITNDDNDKDIEGDERSQDEADQSLEDVDEESEFETLNSRVGNNAQETRICGPPNQLISKPDEEQRPDLRVSPDSDRKAVPNEKTHQSQDASLQHARDTSADESDGDADSDSSHSSASSQHSAQETGSLDRTRDVRMFAEYESDSEESGCGRSNKFASAEGEGELVVEYDEEEQDNRETFGGQDNAQFSTLEDRSDQGTFQSTVADMHLSDVPHENLCRPEDDDMIILEDVPDENGRTARKRSFQSQCTSGDEILTRASKRVKKRVTSAVNVQADPFQRTVQELFAPYKIELTPLFDIPSSPLDPDDPDLDIEPVAEGSSILMDFKLLLYRDWHDEKFEGASCPPKHIKSSPTISRTMALEFEALDYPLGDTECDPKELHAFADRIDNGLSYYHCVNVELLLSLLGSDTLTMNSPYLYSTWTINFRSMVLRLLYSEELLLVDRARHALATSSDDEHILCALTWSQAIFELFLDEFISSEKDRLGVSVDIPVNSVLSDRLQRWRLLVKQLLDFLQDHQQVNILHQIRYHWANTIVAQASGLAAHEVILEYALLKEQLQSQNSAGELLRLPNCQSVHCISPKALELEISKFSTMEFFDAVFESGSKSNYKNVMSQLETVLLDDHASKSKDTELIEFYLDRSTLDFRLEVWGMLITASEREDRPSEVLYAQLRSVDLVLKSLHAERSKHMYLGARQVEIIRALTRISKLLESAISIVGQTDTVLSTWSQPKCIEVLRTLFSYLVLVQVFVYYEDAVVEAVVNAREDLKFLVFRDQLRNALVNCWLLIYQIYKKLAFMTAESTDTVGHNLARLINALHDELGNREYCQLNHGALLVLFENELFALDRAETEKDMVQILHCRYGLSFQVGSDAPWEHNASTQELFIAEALRILPFILTFVREKPSGVWLPKGDLLATLEQIYEVSWSTVTSLHSVSRNAKVIARYMDHDISAKGLDAALRGVLDLECFSVSRPSSIEENSWSALGSLSLVLGRVHLSMFRARNKNNNRGAADLEAARRYFYADLTLHPRRSVSWSSLASIYSTLADTEMGFDAERIWDNRDAISTLRRQAITCYMIATSLLIKSQRSDPNSGAPSQLADLLYEFGQQIYSAAREPLAMKCFARQDLKYVERNGGKAEIELPPVLSLVSALKFASKCLYTASRNCTEPWKCHLLLGKVHEKLQLDPLVALDDYKMAIADAPNHSSAEQGPLIDPHYRLISSVYKFLQGKKIDAATALQYLLATPYASSNDVPQSEAIGQASVVDLIRKSLLNLCQADKKRWHHRPVHRLAVLYENTPQDLCGDLQGESNKVAARIKLESLFTAKGSGSNLLSIWKPDFERPGRHYHYAKQYTTYYMDLLFAQGDLEPIKTFTRRLRRASTSVLHHRDIWQALCERFIRLLLVQNEIPRQDESDVIDVVDLNDFIETCKSIEDNPSLSSLDNPKFRVIRDLTELRRLNGGLYDASKIDDEIINCFLFLYKEQAAQRSALGAQQTMDAASTTSNTLELGEKTMPVQTGSLPNPDTTLTSASTPVLTGTPTPAVGKGRGRPKEPKIVKVGRRDILSRCFALHKPKAVLETEGRGRASLHKETQKADTRLGLEDQAGRSTTAALGMPGNALEQDSNDITNTSAVEQTPEIIKEVEGSGL